MALTDSFPGPNGLTDSIEAGRDIAGLIQHVGGNPKAGIFPGAAAQLVTARSDLRVNIAPFKAALVRNGAVRLTGNDAAAQSPDFTVPTANSRIDVLYVKVGEVDQGDSVDGPFFGILQGTAAAIPAKPVLNIDGALELATVLIPSSATGTASAGVVITQTAPVTTANAVTPDTGWVELSTFGTNWVATPGHPPRVRKIGTRVEIFGAVTWALGADLAHILTIPAAFRPTGTYKQQFVAAGTTNRGRSFTLYIPEATPDKLSLPGGYFSGSFSPPEVLPLIGGWFTD